MGWRNRPTFKEYWPKNTDAIMFIDENGDTALDNIVKKISKSKPIDVNEKAFTITGCVIRKKDFIKTRDDITEIKEKYWTDGKYKYNNKKLKRVCFHSNEIRGEKGPFSKNVINYTEFISDLSNFIDDLPVKIFSSTIDKEEHCRKYASNPRHPYCLCLDFILERFVKFYLGPSEKGTIILEARGTKEDQFILDHIKRTMDNGTYYVGSSYFKKINGVYFNPKWCKKSDDQLSYFGLECTDLLSYPIYKYCKYDNKDMAFKTLERKIYGYPNCNGYGIKRFP